jgi:hypothetical protein
MLGIQRQMMSRSGNNAQKHRRLAAAAKHLTP